ncbi:DEHA2E22176p [Debaryomyces hansenii CBS767]|uniref:DEHA2E22176p n=1 Tax=Debaryomyces hansenii (strain ATCC 36239 / CBS 767 / BCRC 21394 / JCM 1990 / NBRC 0083 / IGC 2968) TaxID=284592 RepID=Q6BNF5_DEBHA|nr:DEHA2E22176p [Debaryomyces hansenii CBS767]CAG88546.2 DEHA2E22176p [Debaryomyces hansenii CBS767]|eukprot:XP_460265.2 DEHA2E22176p [Debaryomyces hansenii CBS767]
MDKEATYFKKQLDELDNDISILSSQKDFQSHMNKINETVENPILINDEINFQKENFSKLKFQYLEQETKEKFLRSLFDNPPISIQQEDINKLQEENVHSKQALKALKESMNNKMNDIHEISRETVELNEEYQHKYNETNKMLDEVLRMEEKINSIIDNQQDETKEIIKSLIDLSSGMKEKDLTKIMISASNKSLQDYTTAPQSSNELHLKNQLNENQQQHLQKLQEKLTALKFNLSNAEDNKEPNDNQFYAQWVKEMNEILIGLNDLSYIKFEFVDNTDLKLIVNNHNVVLNKSFDILNTNELSQFQYLIKNINSNENKMKNFLLLVNGLLEMP